MPWEGTVTTPQTPWLPVQTTHCLSPSLLCDLPSPVDLTPHWERKVCLAGASGLQCTHCKQNKATVRRSEYAPRPSRPCRVQSKRVLLLIGKKRHHSLVLAMVSPPSLLQPLKTSGTFSNTQPFSLFSWKIREALHIFESIFLWSH